MKTELKPEFKAKLLKLGVYRKWNRNRLNDTPVSDIDVLNDATDFHRFIFGSFVLWGTPEGSEFWCKISNS